MTPLLPLLALVARAGNTVDPDATAEALIEAAGSSERAWQRLVELSDDIGPRPAGSAAFDRATAWAADAMAEDGLTSVHLEPVTIDAWERGPEHAALVAPVAEPLAVLGLGFAAPTPPGGLEADVVVVDDFAHLAALGDAVRGKIVLFDVPFTSYGETSAYRTDGPSLAGAQGAVAVLVRSVGPVGSGTLHTGTVLYDDDLPKIPAAAVSAEDAMRLRRYVERGLPVRVRLDLASTEAPRPSANVVGEVVGSRKPKEVVVLACHLDSWDVGRGAQDDGAGCVTMMEAARLLASLPTAPARTVRLVLYTDEEHGIGGAHGYVDARPGQIARHVAAIESDYGAGRFLGFDVDVRRGRDTDAEASAALAATLGPVTSLLAPLGDVSIAAGYGGTDLLPLARGGVPSFGVRLDTAGYWPVHHTAGDTVDKVDPEQLKRNAAAIAVFAWWLAEHPPVVDWTTADVPREGR